MSQHTLATLCAVLILLALITYTVLGGADFGGGIWDLLARGPRAERERSAIARAMGPVWESNNVWLVYVLVITWTAFPLVYAAISTALFIPITLALVGIVLRGAAFGFRSDYGMQVGAGEAWGHVFSWASIVTPFLLGTVVGALAGGGIRASGPPVQVQANSWTTWLSPFSLSCGAFAVALCALLSATYLTVELHHTGQGDLVNVFRHHALWAGVASVVFALLAAFFARVNAPILWNGLVGRALPLVIVSVLLGIAAAVVVWRGYYLVARALVIAETACIMVTWGVAQWPYFIVPDVTVDNAASPASVLGPMLIISVLGLVVLIPSLWYLFSVFKRRGSALGAAVGTHGTTAAFVSSLLPASQPAAGAPTAGAPMASDSSRPMTLPTFRQGESRSDQTRRSTLGFLLTLAVALAITTIPEFLRARHARHVQRLEERGRTPAHQ